ncbi:MAG: hypothetical protein IKD61_09550, partial [Oscillospiraceae bacterium]|nr:hypothetical protein [Oscillospiraceae bacterium]
HGFFLPPETAGSPDGQDPASQYICSAPCCKGGFSRPPDLPHNPSPDGLLFILKNLMIAFQSEIVYTIDRFRNL